MSLLHVKAIFMIQLKDTLKNMQILVLFLIYPLIGFIITKGIPEQPIYFISLFSTMHAVFTPIVSIVTILSEQKEKRVLQSLMFANVTSFEYIVSNGLFVFIFTILTSFLFFLTTTLPVFNFLLAMMIGSIISILIGAAIALHTKNVAAANAISIPIAMLFAFLPMLAMFNETIKKMSYWLYSQQCSTLLIANDNSSLNIETYYIFIFNFLIFLFLFICIYHKSRKEEA